MKLKTPLFVLTTAIFLAGCNYASINKPATTSTTTPTAIATPTPTPTKPQTVNDLNGELNTTVDDGGQADLNQLQTDSKGL